MYLFIIFFKEWGKYLLFLLFPLQKLLIWTPKTLSPILIIVVLYTVRFYCHNIFLKMIILLMFIYS